MKTLYLIGGPMGVGKTTVGQCLKRKLPNAVFLDGDWCWDASPFQVTEETKAMVLRHIRFLLGGFLACSAYDNIIFCWVLHRQEIIGTILRGLDTRDCRVISLSLLASPETLAERIRRDVEAGKRTMDVLQRSLERLPCYDTLRSVRLWTDGRCAEEIAEEIARL